MQQSIYSNKNQLRNTLDHFMSKWNYILLFLVFSISCAYVFLRYSTYEYETNASIKIQEDKKSSPLSEISSLQNYGMFSSDFGKIEDEAQILKSRALIEQVVKDLKLNISYHVKGKIKDQEVYSNPPINLNFFTSDSILNKIDTTLYIKFISSSKFSLSGYNTNELIELNEKQGLSEHAFGDKISVGFSDLIITPNIGASGSDIGSYIKIKLTPVRRIVEKYIAKIDVKFTMQSNIINVSIKEPSRDKAELILNTLIEKYNKDVINDKEDIVKTTSDFISNRLEIVAQELEQVDLTAENMKQTNRLSDLGAQSSIFLQSEKENEAKLVATTNQIQLIDYMSDYLQSNNDNGDLLPANVGIADNGVAQLTKSHNDLVLQRNRILKSSSEKNPTVINLNNQISALKDNLNRSLENINSSNQITLKSLNKEDARINSQIYSAPKKERQFRDISRQQSIKESLYLYLLEKREETAITLGMSSPNAKIIDVAFSSQTPVSPKPLIVYLASIIIGLSFPLLFIYLLDIIDTKVHTKFDVEKILNAPFIGDIPKSSSKKKDRLISKVDYSPKAEAFRMLRTNIRFALKDKKNNYRAKTIFVTSTTSQEGKSHTSINLASSLSFSGAKVLLIETDIRVPKVKDYLNVKSEIGITNYLNDDQLSIKDVTVITDNNKYLHVISSGTIPPNPSELLMNDRINTLFTTVKDQYDYIIVDTAAVGLVTDTLLICDYADIFIYVVSAGNIDKRQLHVAKTMFDENRLPNMHVLLNGTKKKSGYGYGYGYGSDHTKKKWYKFN
ncbi:MAG: polysaccharide biosynthesis tyrosine autokinase [Flavobacteriaceae bacterium]|nr:polysaccharide biosynthesis tyrosine autokinase [Flavobacteriaceae bacterium]